MTQEEKSLLLQDLCARLPYGVKVHLSKKHNRPEEDIVLNNIIVEKDGFVTSNIIGYNYLLSEIKPYLRPMSSMTEEEKEEWNSYVSVPYGKSLRRTPYCIKYMDWLIEHHFDFRHLIEKGLAIEAPESMYNIKDE